MNREFQKELVIQLSRLNDILMMHYVADGDKQALDEYLKKQIHNMIHFVKEFEKEEAKMNNSK